MLFLAAQRLRSLPAVLYGPDHGFSPFPLLGLLITDWQTVLGGWQAAKRRLVKAKQVGAGMAPCLALAGLAAVEVVVEHTVLMMQTGWTIDWRKKRPHIYHLLADPKLIHSFG